MRQILLVTFTLFIACAHADTVYVVDQNGEIIGINAGRDTDGNRLLVSLTGYEALIPQYSDRPIAFQGGVGALEIPRTYYESATCDGQAYVHFNDHPPGWVGRAHGLGIAAYVAQDASRTTITALGMRDGGACESANTSITGYPISENDPGTTGFSFPIAAPPLELSVVQNEILFCNGFESCPTFSQ